MATQADFPNAEILVSVDWLFEHLSDARVKVIDARGTRAYVEGHIPGALVLEASAFKDERSGEPVLPDEFARTAGGLGIQLADTVVCYDDEGPVAARAWWAFPRFGHPDVRFLNGGLTRWTAAGYPLSTASAVVAPTTYRLGQVHDELACSLPQAAVAHKRSDVIFWDTRSPGEYRGDEVRFGAPARPGHIPGAVHLEWSELVDPTTRLLKSADDIRSLLLRKGITPDKEVFTY